jgi:hypothetical protein
MTGVVLSRLMSCDIVKSESLEETEIGGPHLLEGFVVHKTRRILGYVELALLNVFPKLPAKCQYPSRIRMTDGCSHMVAAGLQKGNGPSQHYFCPTGDSEGWRNLPALVLVWVRPSCKIWHD